MRKLVATLVAVATLLVAARADARRYTFRKAKLTIAIPKGWTVEADGSAVIFATADEEAAVTLTWSHKDLDKAWDGMVDFKRRYDPACTYQKAPGSLSGLTGYVASTEGIRAGGKVTCLIAVLTTPGGTMTVSAGGPVDRALVLADFLGGMAPLGATTEAGIAQDDDWLKLSADGQRWATKVVTTIDKNDVKGFIKLVGKDGLSASDVAFKVTQVPAAQLKPAIKAAGGVAGFLGLPGTGVWRVQLGEEASNFTLARGASTGVVVVLMTSKVNKRWQLDGTFSEDHGPP